MPYRNRSSCFLRASPAVCADTSDGVITGIGGGVGAGGGVGGAEGLLPMHIIISLY
jgi:hypothetical protein